jgi:uncharacterized protein YjbI with pentapeptide repeats
MADDKKNPESGAGEAKPLKIKAEDNPWYLLATLYGVPERRDQELRAKNRVAWNRYFAANLDDESRALVIGQRRHLVEELAPFSPEVLESVETAFAERCKTLANKPALPPRDADIDFSNVEFEYNASFEQYLFGRYSLFRSATFTDGAHFNGATFTNEADFAGATFTFLAAFDGALFSREADFGDATFVSGADFVRAAFSSMADFRRATYCDANFTGAAFSGGANFESASFSGKALFGSATFTARANFEATRFCDVAEFESVKFLRGAIFKNATFKYAIFKSAVFLDGAKFAHATFQGLSLFVDAEMKTSTSFEGATFKTVPPQFFGVELHEGTVWPAYKYWPTPKKGDKVQEFVRAYECLKAEMDRLKRHEDELDFFALELQSRVLLGRWEWGLPIALYGLLSDYGRSYARPLYALFAVAAVGTLVLLLSGAVAPWQSLWLSIANTFNVFGFRKDFFDAATIEHLPAALKILALLQTIVGTILLFLFGLGVRNKFHMK